MLDENLKSGTIYHGAVRFTDLDKVILVNFGFGSSVLGS